MCSISRNFTYNEAKKNPVATDTIASSTNRSGKIIIVNQDSGVLLANNINIKTTIKFKSVLINAEEIEAIGIIYLGMLILRIKLPLPTIDFSAPDVASVKKLHKTIPSNNDIG